MSSRELLRYEVARLHRRGLSMRAIGRVLGIDRRTVRRLLEELEADRDRELDAGAERRYVSRPSKLDRYRNQVAELLRRHPDITARRVHEELEAIGFDGGYTIVRDYVRSIRPKPPPARAKRVETAPGHQAQADFSPYTLASGTKIHAFSVVLSHSRFLHVGFTTDERQPTIFRQVIAALESFGGVPEEIVFDSMSGVVDRWELDGPILNLRALDFAAHYGFTYHIAPRANGAYKGKVERPFRYLETNFFNGRTLQSLEHARGALRDWLDTRANCRVHGQTGRIPAEELTRERAHLQPLPARPFDTRELGYRIVDGYGRVHFDGNTYSTPTALSGRRVVVRADERTIEIRERFGTCLVSHTRAPRGAGREVTAPEHVKRVRSVGHDQLLAIFAEWGPDAERFAAEVIQRKRYRRQQLAEILALQDRFAVDDIIDALNHAARYRAFDAASVVRIVEARAEPRTYDDQVAAAVRKHVQQTFGQKPVSKRELQEVARSIGSVTPTGDEAEDGTPIQEGSSE